MENDEIERFAAHTGLNPKDIARLVIQIAAHGWYDKVSAVRGRRERPPGYVSVGDVVRKHGIPHHVILAKQWFEVEAKRPNDFA